MRRIDDHITSMASALRTVAFLVAMAGAGHAQAPAVEVFLVQLQRATQAGDRAAIAAMLQYPITISIDGLRVPFADAAAFLERYDDIFNPALRDAIARASVSAGGVIGANEVRLSEVNGQLRIVSIAVPHHAAGGGTSAVAPAERSTGTARKQEPRRIAIRVGPRATQIPGIARPRCDRRLHRVSSERQAGGHQIGARSRRLCGHPRRPCAHGRAARRLEGRGCGWTLCFGPAVGRRRLPHRSSGGRRWG